MSVHFSFTDWNGISGAYKYIGFANFKDVINELSFSQIILNTLTLTILYVPVLNILALVLATLVFSVGRRIGNFYKSVLFFPNLLCMVVVGFIWKLMYMYDNGLINQTLNALGLKALAQDWLGNPSIVMSSMSLSIIWFATGYYLVIYLAGLTSIPVELYESCDVEGASSMQKFFKITIPLLAPSITINVVLSTIGIIACFDLPFVLTNGGPGYMSETIALQVYHYAFTNLQQGRSLALSMMLTLFAVIIAFLELKFFRKREDIY
jgi:ABC-type sugar transport system permease subunit